MTLTTDTAVLKPKTNAELAPILKRLRPPAGFRDWLAQAREDWSDIPREYVEWALERAAYRLTPERLNACAEVYPWGALFHAADLLTPECLDMCAEADPCAALAYAADLLTPERLDACAQAHPVFARCGNAAHHLTPERLAWCKAQCA